MVDDKLSASLKQIQQTHIPVRTIEFIVLVEIFTIGSLRRSAFT